MQTGGCGPSRSALLVAWCSGWLASEVGLDALVERVTALDAAHVVVGLGPAELPLDRAVGRLRADGAGRLRLVLPIPGDVTGLPGPGPFSSAALAAGEGALALRSDGTGVGLVPTLTAHGSVPDGTVTTVTWSAHEIGPIGPDPGPFLHDAEHDLRRGLVACVDVLRGLDVARWQPQLAGALQQLRAQARGGLEEEELPRGYSLRARQLLVQVRQLAGVLSLATADAGAAVTTAETAGRERALRELEHLVRRACVAAYNSHGYSDGH